MKRIFVGVITLILLNGVNTWAITVNMLLDKMQQKNAQFESLQAHFVQKTTLTTGLKRKKRMEGIVYLKRPKMMRWDYTSPERYHIISNGERIWFYDEGQKQVMIGNINKFFDKHLLYALFLNIKNVAKFFNTSLKETKTEFVLTLIPKQSQINSKRIKVWIKKKDYQIKGLEFEDLYGNQNRIDFQNFTYNKSFRNDFFEFKPPPKVEVIKLP